MKMTFREVAGLAILSQARSAQRGGLLMYSLGALGAMLFSTKAIFVKLAYQPSAGLPENSLEPIVLMVLRMGFALPVYVAILVVALKTHDRPISLRLMGLSVLLGILGYYICTFLDFSGLRYITAQLERLLLFTYPMFVVILGALFFGGRISRTGFGSIVVSYGGIALIFMRGEIAYGRNVMLGSALIIAAAILFALFQLLAKGMIDKVGSRLFTCLAMIGASVAIFIHYGLQFSPSGALDTIVHLPAHIYGLAVLIAFFSTIVPSFLVNIAIAHIGAQPVAVMGMVGPVATIIMAVLWLGEPFGVMDALGTLITLSGIGLFVWFDKKR